jgi:hypothetical protein
MDVSPPNGALGLGAQGLERAEFPAAADDGRARAGGRVASCCLASSAGSVDGVTDHVGGGASCRGWKNLTASWSWRDKSACWHSAQDRPSKSPPARSSHRGCHSQDRARFQMEPSRDALCHFHRELGPVGPVILPDLRELRDGRPDSRRPSQGDFGDGWRAYSKSASSSPKALTLMAAYSRPAKPAIRIEGLGNPTASDTKTPRLQPGPQWCRCARTAHEHLRPPPSPPAQA